MRTYKKKTDREKAPIDVLKSAAELVIDGGRSCRSVAKEFNIEQSNLSRFCKKLKDGDKEVLSGYRSCAHARVFTEAEELKLVQYITTAAQIYFGLTPKEIRKLACEYALKNGKNVPPSWMEKRVAGPDWFGLFMKRNNTLSIRVPEATSYSRATSFNKHNCKTFFDNLAQVYEQYHFGPEAVYNVDETGVTTVQRPSRIVAKKGCKQVGAITSGERGQLVTVACIVNAIGGAIPPMLIFPRVNFKEHFIRDGPTGCIGDANSSGWMNKTSFVKLLIHFVKFSRCSTDNPVLLLLDNHDSHISIESLTYAKENGIVMLSFPPHTSHKLQPLDRTVYFPFKSHVNSASDAWLKNNPGKVMTIYDIPSIVKSAFPLAMTIKNICSGFRVTGIYPFNRDVFQETDFLPAHVTDRPVPSASNETDLPENYISNEPTVVAKETRLISFSPEDICPLPKALPRKNSSRGRQKMKSQILTATPVKDLVCAMIMEREKRKASKSANQERKLLKKISRPINTNISCSTDGASCSNVLGEKPPKKKLKFNDEESDSLEDTEDEYTSMSEIETSLSEEEPSKITFLVGDYSIVMYEEEFFPGIVTSVEETGCQVKVMQMAGPTTWRWPDKDDEIFYEHKNIKAKIKAPELFGSRGIYKVPEIIKLRCFKS